MPNITRPGRPALDPSFRVGMHVRCPECGQEWDIEEHDPYEPHREGVVVHCDNCHARLGVVPPTRHIEVRG